MNPAHLHLLNHIPVLGVEEAIEGVAGAIERWVARHEEAALVSPVLSGGAPLAADAGGATGGGHGE